MCMVLKCGFEVVYCTGIVLVVMYQTGEHHSVVLSPFYHIKRVGEVEFVLNMHTIHTDVNDALYACFASHFFFFFRVDLWNNENLAQDVFLGETRVPVKILRNHHVHRAWYELNCLFTV